ncbi:MAG: cation:proton antiporter, partial [Chloroflexota bacterium]
LAAGIILGPPILGLLQASEPLNILAEVGVLLMMLYIGMEIDPKELFKASWAGMLAAIGGFITPFVLAYLVVIWFGGSNAAGLFVGIAAGVTSLATKSRILVDLNLLNTRIAHVLMAGALISDTFALIVFAAIIGIFDGSGLSAPELGLVAGKAVLFFAVVAAIGLYVFPPLWRRLAKAGLTGRTFNATLILLIALLFAELAHLAGLHEILGAFLAGLFLREGTVLEPKLSHQLNDLVHDVSIGFLAPIFFVTAGFQVSLEVFQTSLLLLIAVTVVATLGKIVGTAVFYLPSGNGWREGVTVGAGMNGRGAVEIIIAQIGLELGIISPEIFSVLVFMAIFTTATVPIFLKWTTEWLDRRGELVRSTEDRRGVLILGAAPTARLLAHHLAERGPVVLIDSNQHNCETAMEEGLHAIQGDALDEDILQDADAETMRTFLALTPNPEVNVLAANLARDVFAIPDVKVLLSHANNLLRRSAERQGFTPIDSLWEDIIAWDKWIEHGEVVSINVTIEEQQDIRNMFDELHGGSDVLALVAEKDGYPMPFPSQDMVEEGDQIVALKRTEPA